MIIENNHGKFCKESKSYFIIWFLYQIHYKNTKYYVLQLQMILNTFTIMLLQLSLMNLKIKSLLILPMKPLWKRLRKAVVFALRLHLGKTRFQQIGWEKKILIPLLSTIYIPGEKMAWMQGGRSSYPLTNIFVPESCNERAYFQVFFCFLTIKIFLIPLAYVRGL